MSTHNVGRDERQTGYSEQPTAVLHQTRLNLWGKKLQVVPLTWGKVSWHVTSGSSHKSSFPIDFCGNDRRSKCHQTFLQNFGTSWNFSVNFIPFVVELQWTEPHTLSWVLPNLNFVCVFEGKQSVYFLLELSVDRGGSICSLFLFIWLNRHIVIHEKQITFGTNCDVIQLDRPWFI